MLRELISEDEFLHAACHVPLQKVNWQLAQNKGIDVFIRRDDLVDEHLSGNKFYKLFYNLHAAKEIGCKTIVSFGGAHSNHLYALAAAGHRFGFNTVGVIRGERPAQLTATLRDANAWGMQLHFVSRSMYRDKLSSELQQCLRAAYGDFFEIPEGGANLYGLMGAKVLGWAIQEQLKADYTSVCLASGTGNTLAGLSLGLGSQHQDQSSISKAIGFSVLKGAGDLGKSIAMQQRSADKIVNNWCLISGYHGGGYGKKLTPALSKFNRHFELETQIPLDPVYTVKMCWGVSQLIQQQYWPIGSRLVLVHTGGLQGRRGYRY